VSGSADVRGDFFMFSSYALAGVACTRLEEVRDSTKRCSNGTEESLSCRSTLTGPVL